MLDNDHITHQIMIGLQNIKLKLCTCNGPQEKGGIPKLSIPLIVYRVRGFSFFHFRLKIHPLQTHPKR